MKKSSTPLLTAIQEYNQWMPQDLIKEYTVRASSSGQGKRYNAVTQLAQDLGVSRRSVERYITTKGAQRRNPGKETKAKLNELGQQFRKPPPERIVLNGKILVGTSPDKARDRTMKIPPRGEMDQAEWEYLSELAEEEDKENEDDAWAELADIFQAGPIELVSGNISIA